MSGEPIDLRLLDRAEPLNLVEEWLARQRDPAHAKVIWYYLRPPRDLSVREERLATLAGHLPVGLARWDSAGLDVQWNGDQPLLKQGGKTVATFAAVLHDEGVLVRRRIGREEFWEEYRRGKLLDRRPVVEQRPCRAVISK